jgi:hypothetical protein
MKGLGSRGGPAWYASLPTMRGTGRGEKALPGVNQ